MKIKQTLGKIFPVLDGASLKRHVAEKVKAHPQHENGVLNVHRHDHMNVGDYYCAPYLYFKELEGKYLDISGARSKSRKTREDWIESVSNNNLIVGGGGLLNIEHFDIQMKLFEELASKGKKIVIWGAGHNDKDYDAFNKNRKYNVDITKFGMAGTRDFSMSSEYIPCVSCLHEIFDRNWDAVQEVGIILNKKSIKKKSMVAKLEEYPFTSNTTNLEEMISFIGRSEKIVTDSYHAMYWAMLLEKKVVVIPTTSKFFDFKYPAIVTSFESFHNDLQKATTYSGLLEECRTLNLKFAGRVFDYLNL